MWLQALNTASDSARSSSSLEDHEQREDDEQKEESRIGASEQQWTARLNRLNLEPPSRVSEAKRRYAGRPGP